MRYAHWMMLVFVTVEVSSCGGSDDVDIDSSVTPEQACSDAAAAFCGKSESCAPFFLKVFFTQSTPCTDFFKTQCLASLKAAHTGATPAAFEQCAREVSAETCTDSLSHNPPASCHAAGGSVTNGGACGDDWQCASGRCSVPQDSTCGVCADRAGAGSACKVDDDCQYGSLCANQLCVMPVPAGMACDANHPCAAPNVCNGATLTAQGTCGAPAAAGQSCANNIRCDLTKGEFCNPQTTTCQSAAIAQAGEPCGLVAGNIVFCGGALFICNGATALNPTGTCPALVDPGGACSDSAPCKTGSKCVSGVCKALDPAACQ